LACDVARVRVDDWCYAVAGVSGACEVGSIRSLFLCELFRVVGFTAPVGGERLIGACESAGVLCVAVSFGAFVELARV